MKTLAFAICFIYFTSITAYCFQTSPTPESQSKPEKTARSTSQNHSTNQYNDMNVAFLPDGTAVRNIILQKVTNPLYREPTRSELATIAPNGSLTQRYAAFLREPNTGLFRLTPEVKCGEGMQVVSAGKDCLKFTMPGGGSSYSFRTGNYRIGRLADITFRANAFQANGIMTHGILVKLGDVPLDGVTMQTAGVKYLSEFQPSADLDEAKQTQKQLANGITSEGFIYVSALTAVEGQTYVLRSIAYRGKSLRAMDGMIFNELDFDERRDVTIAFRIVQRGEDGSVTILWKRLEKKNAPRIKRRAPVKNIGASADTSVSNG